jgi:hypothetical protein
MPHPCPVCRVHSYPSAVRRMYSVPTRRESRRRALFTMVQRGYGPSKFVLLSFWTKLVSLSSQVRPYPFFPISWTIGRLGPCCHPLLIMMALPTATSLHRDLPMTRASWWLGICGGVMIVWNESGENAFLFCYRMGWGAFCSMRSRTLAPVTISPDIKRTSAACLNRFFTSSVRSTILKD